MEESVSEVSIKVKWCSIKIYINNILHLEILKNEIVAVQSWVNDGKYIIEYSLTNRDIKTEYYSRETWESILTQWDQNVMLDERDN